MKDIIQSLHQEYRYIQLVYHRNKNQHGSTHWWRHFNTLKRSISQILRQCQYNKVERESCKYAIKRFLKVQLPAIYYAFQGVLTMGQFVTLGVVLMGLLARSRALLLQLQPEDDVVEIKTPKESSKEVSEVIPSVSGGEDLGMEIVEDAPVEQSLLQLKPTKEDSHKVKKNKKQSKKSKSKKSKSAIDSIFG